MWVWKALLLVTLPQNTSSGVKKKEKQSVTQIIIPASFSDKVTPDINFTDDPVVQRDVPVKLQTMLL